MDTFYRFRFVPFIITSIVLGVILLLKYVFDVEELEYILYYTVFFFVGAIVYIRAMAQSKREKEIQNLSPILTTRETAQQIYENNLQSQIVLYSSNIAIRSVYLFFWILVFSVSIYFVLFEASYIWGIIALILSSLSIIHSICVLKKWISLFKLFKEEKVKCKKVEDLDEEDSFLL